MAMVFGVLKRGWHGAYQLGAHRLCLGQHLAGWVDQGRAIRSKCWSGPSACRQARGSFPPTTAKPARDADERNARPASRPRRSRSECP
jgi:hypothetical protein